MVPGEKDQIGGINKTILNAKKEKCLKKKLLFIMFLITDEQNSQKNLKVAIFQSMCMVIETF